MANKPTSAKTPRTPRTPGAKAAAKPRVGAAKAAKPVVEGETKAATGLRLKALVDSVSESSGIKKKDVKTVIEATLLQMGAALKAGESLNLVGLGRMRVARGATEEGGAITLKLRQGTPGEKAGKADAEPLADADDQD